MSTESEDESSTTNVDGGDIVQDVSYTNLHGSHEPIIDKNLGCLSVQSRLDASNQLPSVYLSKPNEQTVNCNGPQSSGISLTQSSRILDCNELSMGSLSQNVQIDELSKCMPEVTTFETPLPKLNASSEIEYPLGFTSGNKEFEAEDSSYADNEDSDSTETDDLASKKITRRQKKIYSSTKQTHWKRHSKFKSPIAHNTRRLKFESKRTNSSNDSGFDSPLDICEEQNEIINESIVSLALCLKHEKVKQRRNFERIKEITRTLYISSVQNIHHVYGLGTCFDGLNSGYSFSADEELQFEWFRFITFKFYGGNGHAIALARNGFYHDRNVGPESTRCFSCNGRYDRWCLLDDIARIHRRISPNCPMHSNPSTGRHNISIEADNVPSIPLDSPGRYRQNISAPIRVATRYPLPEPSISHPPLAGMNGQIRVMSGTCFGIPSENRSSIHVGSTERTNSTSHATSCWRNRGLHGSEHDIQHQNHRPVNYNIQRHAQRNVGRTVEALGHNHNCATTTTVNQSQHQAIQTSSVIPFTAIGHFPSGRGYFNSFERDDTFRNVSINVSLGVSSDEVNSFYNDYMNRDLLVTSTTYITHTSERLRLTNLIDERRAIQSRNNHQDEASNQDVVSSTTTLNSVNATSLSTHNVSRISTAFGQMNIYETEFSRCYTTGYTTTVTNHTVNMTTMVTSISGRHSNSSMTTSVYSQETAVSERHSDSSMTTLVYSQETAVRRRQSDSSMTTSVYSQETDHSRPTDGRPQIRESIEVTTVNNDRQRHLDHVSVSRKPRAAKVPTVSTSNIPNKSTSSNQPTVDKTDSISCGTEKEPDITPGAHLEGDIASPVRTPREETFCESHRRFHCPCVNGAIPKKTIKRKISPQTAHEVGTRSAPNGWLSSNTEPNGQLSYLTHDKEPKFIAEANGLEPVHIRQFGPTVSDQLLFSERSGHSDSSPSPDSSYCDRSNPDRHEHGSSTSETNARLESHDNDFSADRHKDNSLTDKAEHKSTNDMYRHEDNSSNDRHEYNSSKDRYKNESSSDRHDNDSSNGRHGNESSSDRHEDESSNDSYTNENDISNDRHENDSSHDRHENESSNDRHGNESSNDRHEDESSNDRHEDESSNDRPENENDISNDRHGSDSSNGRNKKESLTDRPENDSSNDRYEDDSSNDRHKTEYLTDRHGNNSLNDIHEHDFTNDRTENESNDRHKNGSATNILQNTETKEDMSQKQTDKKTSEDDTSKGTTPDGLSQVTALVAVGHTQSYLTTNTCTLESGHTTSCLGSNCCTLESGHSKE